MTKFTKRYERQQKIVDQEKLKKAKVLVAGCGGLGSAVLYYLAAAGVGYIKFIDKDCVEESNLNRQILHFENDISKPKVLSAYEKLNKLNSEIRLLGIEGEISENSINELLKECDLIIDCLDNIQTRLLINNCAYRLGIPLIHGAVEEFEGRVAFINPKNKTGCLSCIYQIPNTETKPFQILGATAGVIGSIQAKEAISYLCTRESRLDGKMLFADLKNMSFKLYDLPKRAGCICNAGGNR